MQLSSGQRLDDHVLERRFTLGEVNGFLWTPVSAPGPTPLVLVGHPGGLDRLYPRVSGRARYYATEHAFSSVTVELPGSGERPRVPELEEARADLRTALQTGDPLDGFVERLVLPLVDLAVPEWQAVMDAVLSLPEIDGPVVSDGGVISIGVRLARIDPRLVAAVLFAGSFVPGSILEEARHVTIPLQVLLQWDDEGNDRQQALDLFDAFGSTEKTLHANLGGHTGIPAYEMEAGARFFDRHLPRMLGMQPGNGLGEQHPGQGR